MKVDTPSPEGFLTFASQSHAATMSRQRAAGRAVQLAPGVYVRDASLPREELARRHLYTIAAHFWPGAVVTDRSAPGGQPHDGWLFLAHPAPPRRADLHLPGVAVTCRVGPGPLPGDKPFLGLHLAGVARGLVDNVLAGGRPPKGRPVRAAGAAAVGDAVDELARRNGVNRVRNALAELDVIAGYFQARAVGQVRDMLRGVLGTVSGGPVASQRLASRLGGQPYDAHRLGLFRALVATCLRTAPAVRPVLGDPIRWDWLPFFEAYFSNYIEGTIFSVEEARDIAVHGVVPASRPADAHDVAATFRLVSATDVMATVPRSGQDLADLLAERHAVLMAARPDRRPGQFKTVPNFAGGYEFVAPELLLGTLHAGFDVLAELTDPFHRAVAMMFLVAECHPFDDGNGRLARIMMNAELVVAGQMRAVIPSVYRNNYLASLSGTSNGAGQGESLISVLDFARRWVAAVDWSSWESALADLEASNATADPGLAEQTGQRLRLPG